MNVTKWSRTALAACVVAATAACSSNSGDARTEGARANGGEGSPITVAGCLQKGDGSNFILTRINEPTQSVGTGGAAANRAPGGASGDAAEREQLRSAAGAYRIDADDDLKLDGLVGKEVRIVGTIEDTADLPRPGQSNDRVEIKEGDLYEIEAESVTTLNEVCRGGESPGAANSGVTR